MALLDRFFKPKWQHPNPQVRKLALQALDPQDPVLLQLAREDEDPGLRREALGRLNDLSLLQQVAREDREAGVREYAQARFRTLLAGKDSSCPALEQRLNLLKRSHSDEMFSVDLLEFLAIHGAEPELRLAALEQTLHTQALFTRLAINDPAQKVRTAALERISDLTALEQVSKQTRNRDKRVSRIARERLEQQRSEQRRNDHIQQLCSEMEALTWDGETGSGAARFVKLEDQWRELAGFADEVIRQRYQQARDRFYTRLQESAAARQARQALCQSLLGQLGQLQAGNEHSASDESSVTQLLEQVRQQWDALGAIEKFDMESQRLERQFAQLCQEIDQCDRQLHNDRQQARQRRLVLQSTEELLQKAGQVLEADVHDLRQRWQRLPQLNSPLLLKELQSHFDTLLERLRHRLQLQTQQKEQELEALQDLIERLEQALDEGELQQAIELESQTQNSLQHNISLSHHQMAQFRSRLQVCAGIINRLRDWRRWGTNRVRENLCEEIEKLSGRVENPVELARLIRAARKTWQELDNREGSTSRPFWKRFNDACEQAYEPCRVYFEEQAQERQQNFDNRVALCECLENFEVETDWENMSDWRAVGRFEQDIQNQWRNLGPVNRGDRKTIDKRYQEALRQLQARLNPQIEQDLQRRRGLIQQVEKLLESDDLKQAIEQVKTIQAQWQPQILASRRREQAMWKQFRAACDAIFARRQSERDVQEAMLQTNLEQKTKLCERVEELAEQQGATLLQARTEVAQIRQQWESIGVVPKNAARSLDRRFSAACSKFEKSLLRQERIMARAGMDGLRERAALCRRLEMLLTAGEEEDIDAVVTEVHQQWESLTGLKADLEAAVKRRYETACGAVRDASERQQLLQTLHENQAKKKLLCLRMEIATGSKTPAAFAQDRLEYQVSRLSESMVERSGIPTKDKARAEADSIEREWYAMGSLPIDQNQMLEQRFQDALATSLES